MDGVLVELGMLGTDAAESEGAYGLAHLARHEQFANARHCPIDTCLGSGRF
jgi:hypothetical protein